ncbi:hypothetical protein D8S78_14690 [Natrialba swarupiae]|nr:hypothetical protein [Natrialba swarupiae]
MARNETVDVGFGQRLECGGNGVGGPYVEATVDRLARVTNSIRGVHADGENADRVIHANRMNSTGKSRSCGISVERRQGRGPVFARPSGGGGRSERDRPITQSNQQF